MVVGGGGILVLVSKRGTRCPSGKVQLQQIGYIDQTRGFLDIQQANCDTAFISGHFQKGVGQGDSSKYFSSPAFVLSC